MGVKRELQSALAVAAVAAGMDFVSGRALAAFYAQTARASWLGVMLSGLMFGLLTGAISGLARRTGSRNIAAFFRRIPGGGTGRLVHLLYLMLLLAAACMLLDEAAHTGALMLPIRHAGAVAAGFVLLLAGALALSGSGALRGAGSLFALCLLAFELALLCFAVPPENRMLYELELNLRDNWAAAMLFSLLHSAVGICLGAGLIVRLTDGSTHPARLSFFTGLAMLLLLLAGNAALQSGGEKILALKLPFVALSGAWGSAGFYTNAVLMLVGSVLSLAGILHGLLPAGSTGNTTKNDVKL